MGAGGAKSKALAPMTTKPERSDVDVIDTSPPLTHTQAGRVGGPGGVVLNPPVGRSGCGVFLGSCCYYLLLGGMSDEENQWKDRSSPPHWHLYQRQNLINAANGQLLPF